MESKQVVSLQEEIRRHERVMGNLTPNFPFDFDLHF